jgi:signal transduction histidine kinase
MAHLPVVPESNAGGDVKRVFEEIQREKRLPFVPNFFKSLKKLRDSNAALESLVAQRTASLRDLSQRLMRMQDEERRRVARDLHDSTGQTLAALKMNVASLQKRLRV